MDTALKNGDFERSSTGYPKQVSGVSELFQRAEIRLTVPLGKFDYDPALGSALGKLNPQNPDCLTQALCTAQEALRPIDGVTAESVRWLTQEPPVLAVKLSCMGESMEVQVKLP